MRPPTPLVYAALALLLTLGTVTTAGAAEPADAGKSDTAAEPDRCRPTDIIFLIDNSASFTGASAQVKAYAAGARRFLESLGSQHRISMIKFGEDANVIVEPIANTAENRETLVNAIEALRMNEPWTNVYAGVDLAFRKIRVDKDRRGVVLMISDGAISMHEPGSTRESDAVKAQQKQWIAGRLPDAKGANASFFTVAYQNKFTDNELLKQIADGTGGFYAMGDNDTLEDTMKSVAVEMCKRDPIPVKKAAPIPVAPVAPPVVAPPVVAPPIAPPPVVPPAGAPIGLILALAGAGVVAVAGGVMLMGRGRRRRRAAAAATSAAHMDVFSGSEGGASAAAIAAGAAGSAAAAAAAKASQRRSGGGGGAEADRFFTRSETITMDAVPESPRAKGKSGSPSEPRSSGSSGSTISPPSAGGSGRPGSAAAPAAAIDHGRTPDAVRGPPAKPPGWGEQHMMKIVGFTTGGNEIKEVDFRRSGDVVVAVGTGGGAVIPVPPEKGNVRGSVRYTVEKDGTRVVRVHEIPPGGFRDRDTGVALREGDVLNNNQKIEWVKEDRGRYFEVFYK